jgi:DNA polymerase-4
MDWEDAKSGQGGERRIIHIDMDAFFASVEQRDTPELRGKPVVVGGPPDSRGVVCTCSYEARVYGIRSAMPCAQAWRLCPEAVFVRPRFAAYEIVSRHIRRIFLRYTDCIEPLSLDEAYLDVSLQHLMPAGRKTLLRIGRDASAQALLDEGMAGVREIAQSIRQDIARETGLTASAGVASNKFLAKLASDVDKPDGLTVILPSMVTEFMAGLPIERFWGVGKVTAGRLRAKGIVDGASLVQRTREELVRVFGRSGLVLWEMARGIDERPVESQRERKSYGRETTFQRDIESLDEIEDIVESLVLEVSAGMTAAGVAGTTITVKVRSADFVTVTRSHTMPSPTCDAHIILGQALALLAKTRAGKDPVRLVGVSVSGFEHALLASEQPDLPFPPPWISSL